CVLGDSAGRNFYLLDASFTQWGGFLTWNALQYGQTGDASFLASDGAVDFDPACLGDGDFSDCAGRLFMVQDPLCVPEFQVREVYIDFDEIDECAANGDVTLDDVVNILDVVNLVQAILGLEDLSDNQVCNADISQDGVINILDVVAIVQAILGNRGIDATEIQIFNNENSVSIESNGYVGAIQMTLNHSEDFAIELTDNAFIADYNTEGNTTTLMVVAPEGKELFTAIGNFEIVETLAANSNDYLDVVNPEVISLGSAYPNPFNPTTSFELSVGNAGHVTMNVYNVMGQVVETLVNNTMDAGNYNITWDAANFSSGMYVVKAETANGLASQKVMLVK
ncbi:MAG: T9SS type A sorting domain-containing protein, partial [Candidatus Neomarinimicrobiota bacterium]